MKNKLIFNQIQDITAQTTSHAVGLKKVLIEKSQCESNLMQAAFGELERGLTIEEHSHSTMEEFYVFNKGVVFFNIEGKFFECVAGSFLKVPANTYHSLVVKENTSFIYWGIAL